MWAEDNIVETNKQQTQTTCLLNMVQIIRCVLRTMPVRGIYSMPNLCPTQHMVLIGQREGSFQNKGAHMEYLFQAAFYPRVSACLRGYHFITCLLPYSLEYNKESSCQIIESICQAWWCSGSQSQQFEPVWLSTELRSHWVCNPITCVVRFNWFRYVELFFPFSCAFTNYCGHQIDQEFIVSNTINNL